MNRITVYEYCITMIGSPFVHARELWTGEILLGLPGVLASDKLCAVNVHKSALAEGEKFSKFKVIDTWEGAWLTILTTRRLPSGDIWEDNDSPTPSGGFAVKPRPLGSHVVEIIWWTYAGGAIREAINDFNNIPNFQQSAINCETNADTHTFGRALQEASDLNAWFNAVSPIEPRLRARTASFCMERSGHFDAFDQGLIFFLPNMSWLQPPGYVHQIISTTWEPNGLAFTANPPLGTGLSLSSQISQDGNRIVVRIVNLTPAIVSLSLNFENFSPSANANLWTLTAQSLSDANTPGNPSKISPVHSSQAWRNGEAIMVQQNSYTVIQFIAGIGTIRQL